MAIKKLTPLAAKELGIEEQMKGKIWAYAPTITGDIPSLGIAVANEKGYCPVSAFFANADTYDEIAAHADELNLARGLDLKTAFRIVASTMDGKRFVAEGEAEPAKAALRSFTPEETLIILETARRALADADLFDEIAGQHDIADDVMAGLRDKLQAAMADTSGPIRLGTSSNVDHLLPSNEDRAERVAQVYEMYQANTGVDDQESFVSDLLADVMHFCQREDIDFEAKTVTAEMHFEAECEDEENLSDAPRG
jgi:hypothetical protein